MRGPDLRAMANAPARVADAGSIPDAVAVAGPPAGVGAGPIIRAAPDRTGAAATDRGTRSHRGISG